LIFFYLLQLTVLSNFGLLSLVHLRNLDRDLGAVCSAAQTDLDWQRIPFVLEAIGRSKKMFLASAQAKGKDALKASVAAAYNLWKTQLVADQSLFEATKLRTAQL